ncbi:MAG: magnesium transporter CorA [Myxococcales bacterium]|nr:magnesium transporter CorA [Myxococcales bacterium]
MSTESGLLDAFLLDGKGGAQRLDWAGVSAWTPSHGVLWVNIDYSAPDAMRWLETESGIDPVSRDALVDADPRPRAIAHGDALMVIVRGINQNQGSEPEDMISVRVWAEPNRVITMRHRVSRSLKTLAADAEVGRGPRGAADVVVQLVDRIVDHVVMRVDTLGDDIAASEDLILSEKRGADLRAHLADHRRRAIGLRRFLAPQREALTKLASIPLPWLTASERQQVAESADRMMRSIEELDSVRDRAAVTQEEIASRMGELTNQRLYVLSIITAVFLPLGFVCSLLGVNVGGVPLQHSEWAFWALLALFVVGVAIQLWIFRRRGWIKRD